MSMKSIRTRIPPSPTGYVHIGTLRTALFNYFFAKQNGGDFIIRIEDTDRERLVEGSVENLLSTFEKIGIVHTEGPFLEADGTMVQKGDHGPYIQSERLDIYKGYVDKLLASGDAYYCFDSKEELEKLREEQRATKQRIKYDRRALKLGKDEVAKKLEAGESHVIRMKIPEGKTVIEDLIRGTIEFDNQDVGDQIIMKSDGYPTYHLAVVVDDHLMKVTHIMRGEEWISSTPKHVILYKMLGFDLPVFAHMPLLLNPDKSKLSKRQGDVSVEDYLKKGYVKEALINFIGTLGYNPKSDQEIYSFDELIELFDITKVNKSGAVINHEKLDWMNNHYIRTIELEDLIERSKAFTDLDLSDAMMRRAFAVERERMNRLEEINEKLAPYTSTDTPGAEMLTWKKADVEDAKQQLSGLSELMNTLEEQVFTQREEIETAIKNYIEEKGLQNGNVLWPLRVALSGREKSPSPFEMLWIYGKDKSIERIENAVSVLNESLNSI
jgi:glutamyl-tRNA synthetase